MYFCPRACQARLRSAREAAIFVTSLRFARTPHACGMHDNKKVMKQLLRTARIRAQTMHDTKKALIVYC
jgi:hypothetical protein